MLSTVPFDSHKTVILANFLSLSESGKDRSGSEFFASGADRQGLVRRGVQRTGQTDATRGCHQDHRPRGS